MNVPHRPSRIPVLVASWLLGSCLLISACGGGGGGGGGITLVGLAITPPSPSIALGFSQALVATGTYSDMTTRDVTAEVAWDSDDPAIATVSNTAGSQGQVSTLATGSVQITVTDATSGITASSPLTVTAAVLVTLEVTPPAPSLALGFTQQFTATGVFSDSTTQDVTTDVTWSSSDIAMATIRNDAGAQGLASCVGLGTATITASHAGAAIQGSASLSITPAVLVSIAVTPPTPSLALGYEQPFTATGTFSDSTTQDLTDSVTWSSSSPATATISNASGSHGLATSVATGATTITATDTGTNLTGSTTLDVTPAVLVSIAVDPPSPSLALGYEQPFTATGTFSDSTTQDLTDSVTWSSSSSATATISNASGSHGLATSAAAGATTITATDPGTSVAGSTNLTVTPAVLVALGVDPVDPSLALGYEQAFTATGTFSDGTTEDLTTSVTWDSSSPATATISNASGSHGLATSAAAGATTISATDAGTGLSGSTTLTVTPAVLVALAVDPVDPSIALGYEQAFTATGTFSDGTTQDLTTSVTWDSSSAATATISNAGGSEGLATSAAPGVTTITATDAGTSLSGSSTLSVTAAVLVAVAVDPVDPSLALGYEQPFTATGTFSDGTTQDLTTSVTWDSSSPATATISNASGSQGLATSAAPGLTTITATDAGTSVAGSSALTVTPAVLVALAVDPVDPSLALGFEQAFTATGTFSDNTTQDLTSSVTWSSSNEAVAVVSNAGGSAGLASSQATGATTITATDAGSGIDGSTTLTVTPAVLVAVAVDPVDPSLALGFELPFTATGTFSDSTTQDLTASVTWSSSSEATAVVSNAGGSEGLATSLATGSTTITATDAGTGLSGSTTLTVTSAVLLSIDVTPALPFVALGYGQPFTATGTFSDSTIQDLTTSVTWGSSNPAAATISNASGSEGLASTLATGSTTIGATDSGTGIQGSTSLTVTPAVLVSIDVAPATPSLALGFDQPFTATGTFSDGSQQDLTSAVTWSSSNTATATISNASGSHGLASSLATGATTITATDAGTGLDGTALLTVTPAVLVSIAVTPATPSLALGFDQPFTATGTFSDATTQDLTTTVTWSSSITATATLSNALGSEGLASSLAPGATTVTATDAGTGVAGSTTLTVTSAVLVSIAVTPTTPSVALGFTQQFTATGTFSNATTQDLTTAVTWSSSSTATATISNANGSHGLATSAATGNTTITATDPGSGINGSTTLSVAPAVLTAIVVSPIQPSIALGFNQPFTATGVFSDSSTQNLTASVTWSSSNPAVATISNAAGTEGRATSVAQGTTTIQAVHGGSGFSDSTSLLVGDPIVFRQASTTTGVSGVLSLALAKPATLAAGDVMLAAIAVRPSGVTITPPSGWTLVRLSSSAPPQANSLVIYRRVATASEPASYTWTLGNSQGSAGTILAFQGVDTVTPIHLENGQGTVSSLSHSTASLTTTLPNTMIVTFHSMSSSATWTSPAGMTEVVDVASDIVPTNGGVSLTASWQFQLAAGATGVRTATASNNPSTGNASILALRD